jgi:CRISPR-associated protein Cst2
MFITGIIAIHAPASALNNGEAEDIGSAVKKIRVQRDEYPYVSSQSGRYWLRETWRQTDATWQPSPIYRGKGRQQAYTAGDPLTYWDDDLFGYMRAEKGEKRGRGKGEAEAAPEDGEKGEGTLTRIAPFRLATLIASAPAEIVDDFGVMARDAGNPVLHGHEFYRATLVGGFSIDLSAVGTFTTLDRSGYRNLGRDGMARAQAAGLEALDGGAAYRLPFEERARRVASLLRAFGRLQGGAKQTLHYTDVSPAFVCMAVLSSGGNPFLNLFAPQPAPALHLGALDEALTVFADDYASPVVVGLRQGFMDSAYATLAERSLTVVHPRQAFDALADALPQHPEWFA